jgi:hypothetical protein
MGYIPSPQLIFSIHPLSIHALLSISKTLHLKIPTSYFKFTTLHITKFHPPQYFPQFCPIK